VNLFSGKITIEGIPEPDAEELCEDLAKLLEKIEAKRILVSKKK